jgi:hypothetical protein
MAGPKAQESAGSIDFSAKSRLISFYSLAAVVNERIETDAPPRRLFNAGILAAGCELFPNAALTQALAVPLRGKPDITHMAQDGAFAQKESHDGQNNDPRRC